MHPDTIKRLGLALVATVAVAVAEAKDHVLFMGTDLAVKRGGSFFRVEDVEGSAFLVNARNQAEPVPLRRATVRVDKRLKLATARVHVTKLRGDRTYTPALDPRLQFDRQSGAAAGAKAAADVADAQAAIFETAAANARANADANRADALENEQHRFEGLERMANEALASDLGSPGHLAGRMRGEVAEGNFDALEVEFEVSAPEPVADAYVVVISRFRPRGTRAGATRTWVCAKPIGAIGPKPRYLRLREGGFPRGFILEGYELHFYEDGRELATNVSENLVEISRAEAQEFLLLEHLAANREQTVPARPAAGRLPADLRKHFAEGRHGEPYYVKVDTQGNSTGVFTDPECRHPVTDEYVTELFAGLLFKPALEKGKPIVAVCEVRLPELRI